MKKVMFALCFMLGGIVVVSAQETQDTTSNQYRPETPTQYPQDQDRERIQSTELPDAVKRSLEGQEYRGWLVNGAYISKSTTDQSQIESDTTSTDVNQQGKEIYIVELKNGAETKTVRFDKDGKKIEGMEGQDQNNQFNQNDQIDQNQQTDPNTQPDQSIPNDQSSPNSQDDQTTPK